jgi:hypothetical protein
MSNEARCIICGCTDSWGCDGGCAWVRVSRARRIGLCTSCDSPANRLKLSKRLTAKLKRRK